VTDFEGWGYGFINNISFSPDGTVFAASDDDRVKFWSCPDAKLLLSILADTGATGFSPDGRYFVTNGDHGLLKLWGVTG
jgi:WD40 repeat protein